ncbi:Bgt-20529 [Blumeria graminis f. sp. tritici]|uniref:Bgt-20529 n=2 Tax=Blumeria graminis f. sp. tritici TaxID=62690 RepID=A0A381LIM2_BLUGR|nr:Bgt-20529 [Blumeria graminis f. sp. tritici]
MLKISFDFGSDSILLGYPRYAELTERSNQHSWKVTNSALPSIAIGDIECA